MSNKEKIKEFFKNKKILFSVWACESKSFSGHGTPWIPLLKEYSQNVTVFDPQKCMYHLGKEEMNKKFLEIVEIEKPDYIFFWLIDDEFKINTLTKIKEISPNTKLLNFFTDDDTLFENYSRYYDALIDCCLITPQLPEKFYKEQGWKNTFFYIAITGTERFKPIKCEKIYDITFIGTPKRDRADFIRYLIKNGVKIKIFGLGWEEYSEFKEIYLGRLNNEDFVKIINQSKINLCFTKNYFGIPHIKGRIFEIGACRSFVLSEYYDGYLKFFKKNKEIVMFKNKEELLEKIKYYLENEKERESISYSIYKKIMKKHKLSKEVYRLFLKMFEDRKKKPLNNKLKTDKKIRYLTKKDLSDNPQNKIKNVDYIGFRDEKSLFSKYRDYFQIFSLEKTDKKISCCDYYVNSKRLGDYLRFSSKWTLKTEGTEYLEKFLDITQLIVKKEFFLENIELFKKMWENEKVYLIDENNTIFVSIPLIKLNKIKEANYEIIKKSFSILFFIELTVGLFNKKKIPKSIKYGVNLVIESINRKKFILEHIYEKISKKLKTNKKVISLIINLLRD